MPLIKSMALLAVSTIAAPIFDVIEHRRFLPYEVRRA